MSDTPAGWYDDGSGRQRWWDGAQWTNDYAPAPPTQPPAPVAPQPVVAAQVKYETKTIQYIPGRQMGPTSIKTLHKFLNDGWEIVSEKHRFGSYTTATLRRPKADKRAKK
ncbi:DUF2510 domain-containing protein [Plantibacter sp. YIM 135249]|uniref:DUF2510 domain-containing protein n=1 Tax=Plantibacter sp. YIM 135249 TaxID=3423918 RepID=UPI003D3356AB